MAVLQGLIQMALFTVAFPLVLVATLLQGHRRLVFFEKGIAAKGTAVLGVL